MPIDVIIYLIIWVAAIFFLRKRPKQENPLPVFLEELDGLSEKKRVCFCKIVDIYWLQNKKGFVERYVDIVTKDQNVSVDQRNNLKIQWTEYMESFHAQIVITFINETKNKQSFQCLFQSIYPPEVKKLLVEIVENSRQIFESLREISETDKIVSKLPESYARSRLDYSVGEKRFNLMRKGYYHGIFEMLL